MLYMTRREVAEKNEYHNRIYRGSMTIAKLTADWETMADRIALLPCDTNVESEPGTPDCGNCLPCVIRVTKPDTGHNSRTSDCSDEWPCHDCLHGSSHCGYQDEMTRDGCRGHRKTWKSKMGIGQYEERRK